MSLGKAVIVLWIGVTFSKALSQSNINSSRSFRIDYEKNSFMMDGRPFRYISGSIHYYRVVKDLWRDRLTKIKAAGFDTIQFYVQWNLHEPSPGQFDFSGRLDLEHFLDLTKSLGLYAIVRPGPYICAERDGGGLPYWLYAIHPDISLRSADPRFLIRVEAWWGRLLPILRERLYENGGNVIMVQLENEYGSYGLQTGYCDIEYMNALKAIARHHLGPQVVLFTTDGFSLGDLRCGKTPGVYATVDFGPGTDPKKAFHNQRQFEPQGPLVNSEFYSGWLDYWGIPHHRVGVNESAAAFERILQAGANVNVYMVHGGTSFGFEAGANAPPFQPQPTSYDYDALISESGELTEKYYAFKKIIAKYTTDATAINEDIVDSGDSRSYGRVRLSFVSSFFFSKDAILKFRCNSTRPMTFEQLDQASGFVLYETTITELFPDPAKLVVGGLHDRGYIYVDNRPKGILSRGENCMDMPLSVRPGNRLQILVENQGRICYGKLAKDFKGIIGNVTLNGRTLPDWTMYSMPLDNGQLLGKYASSILDRQKSVLRATSVQDFVQTSGHGSFWKGTLKLPCEDSVAKDTFLRLDSWTKGMAFINGFNLGRYWPIVGPQVTLYVPSTLLKPKCQKNEVIIFELETPGCHKEDDVTCSIEFVDTPEIDGPTPGRKHLPNYATIVPK